MECQLGAARIIYIKMDRIQNGEKQEQMNNNKRGIHKWKEQNEYNHHKHGDAVKLHIFTSIQLFCPITKDL